MRDFDIPSELSERGKTAAQVIAARLRTDLEDPSGGGCRAFYTPEEWEERGEEYGTKSVLVVVHDGGDQAPYFNMDYCRYQKIESMQDDLEKVGLYAEQCTGWYSAVYER